MKKLGEKRFWEIDFLRGLAIIVMVTYHVYFNLTTFGDYSIDLKSGFWLFCGRSAAILFLTLAGISLYLSYSQNLILLGGKPPFVKYLKRGLTIFSWGLLITLLTWTFTRSDFIIFGILNLIGVSVIISYPFLKLHRYNILLALPCILGGFYLQKHTFSYP